MKEEDKYSFENIFTFDNLLTSANKCFHNVKWKTSVQKFKLNLVMNITKLYNDLHRNKYKLITPYYFTLNERGKSRKIQSLNIRDRVVQKCLCDYCLIPLLQPSFVYDNGACLKGKGVSFTIKRLKCHLQKYYRKNKSNNGYILLIDIKSFFSSIDHKEMINVIKKKIKDEKIINLYSYILNYSNEEKGLNLGSEISQISSLYFLNNLDHYIKENLREKYYGRYMDDMYIINKDKEKLKDDLIKINSFLEEIKLKLNNKKTRITTINKKFTFLNKNWTLKENNFIEIGTTHKTRKRIKTKYKKLKKILSYKDFQKSLNSTLGFLGFYNSRRNIIC